MCNAHCAHLYILVSTPARFQTNGKKILYCFWLSMLRYIIFVHAYIVCNTDDVIIFFKH